MNNSKTKTIATISEHTQVLLRDTGKVLKVKTNLNAGKASPILFLKRSSNNE
jgi:hypothetical protein